MVIFPETTLVNIKPGFITDQKCKVIIRLFDLDDETESVGDILSAYDKRIECIDTDCKTIERIRNYEFFARYNVRLYVTENDIAFIQKTIRQLRNQKIIFYLEPQKNVKRLINILCELKKPYHLKTTVGEDETILPDVIDYFFYNRLLSSQITPFDVLIRNEIKGRGFTLWDTEYEKVGKNFYISDTGTVSASKRLLDNDVRFGSVDNTWNEIIESAQYCALADFKNSLFKRDADCVYCSYYNMCEGFFKAADMTQSCDVWQKGFAKIKSEVKKMKSLVEDEYGK